MVRFSRVCLAAVPMCHPQVIKSRQWTRHDGGNTLQYQDPYEGLRALPLKVMECGKSWDGNTSDTQIFKARAEALVTAVARSPTPRYLVADAKLYTEDTAPTLAQLGFITRNPGTL